MSLCSRKKTWSSKLGGLLAPSGGSVLKSYGQGLFLGPNLPVSRYSSILHSLWQVLLSKLNLSGMEARVDDLYESGFIDRFTPVQRDALHIYNVMKDLCQRDGHTYLLEKNVQFGLKQSKCKVCNLRDALDFLEENKVIVMETPHSGGLRLYLRRYWEAETGIASGVQQMKGSTLQFDLDLSR